MQLVFGVCSGFFVDAAKWMNGNCCMDNSRFRANKEKQIIFQFLLVLWFTKEKTKLFI